MLKTKPAQLGYARRRKSYVDWILTVFLHFLAESNFKICLGQWFSTGGHWPGPPKGPRDNNQGATRARFIDGN